MEGIEIFPPQNKIYEGERGHSFVNTYTIN